MQMSGITDIGANAAQEAQEQQNGDYESDYERFDVSGLDWVKQHPVTAVVGTADVLRYFPNWDDDEPDRGYFGVVMSDPSVFTDDDELDGTVILARNEDMQESGDDFKVVNLDDDQTKELPGGGGIDFAGNTFYGEQVDEFDTDQIVLKATGSSGRSVAATLDVKGAVSAQSSGYGDDEEITLHGGGFPEHNGGLVEYHPDGRDGERPRIARDPQLRPDVEGEQVVVMIQRLEDIQEDYEGPAYWASVLAPADVVGDVDDENVVEVNGTEMAPLSPTDEFEPDDGLIRETGYIQWRRPTPDEINEAREAEGLDRYDFDTSDEAEAEA